MLQSTPMLSRHDNADTRACQSDTARPMWTRTGMVDTQPLIVAVARAYNDVYHPAADVTPDAILGPGRPPAVAQARHLCAYLLAEDYHLTNLATAHALGRTDHTTALNSRARIMAALDHDDALQRALMGARAILNGHDHAQRAPRRPTRRHRETFATVTPQELAEYRYWRVQSLRSDAFVGARLVWS